MIVKKPPEVPVTDRYSIFLAGSIEMGTAENWQEKVMSHFDDVLVTIFNPRRDDFDSNADQSIDNDYFRGQVLWELAALDRADLVIMYFSPETKSPITLLELGMISQRKPDKLIVCCPKGYWRKGNVDIVCRYQGVKQVETLDELIKEAIYLCDIDWRK